MEVVPQVHLVPGTRGASVYLIVEESGLTAVDAGLPRSAGAILRYVDGLGRRPEDLTRIILTHHHMDHGGGADELQARTGAEVMMHEGNTVERRKEVTPRRTWLFVRFLGRLLEPFGDPRCLRKATLLKDGQVLPVLGGLQVIHTPGHTSGCACFYSRERKLLFVGDTVLNNVSRLSRPIASYDAMPHLYRGSLRRLASLEFETCLFGHGPPVVKGASRLVRRLADRQSTKPLRSFSLTPGRLLRLVHRSIEQRLASLKGR